MRSKAWSGSWRPLDAAMIAALPFGGTRVPWTADGGRIRRGVAGITGQASSVETGSELACRTRRFLESLEGFLAEQPAAARPSTLVIFTAGLAAPRRDAAMAEAPGMCELVSDQFRRLTALASAARVNVYVAVPVDIALNTSRARESIAGVGYLGFDNPIEGIEHFEGVTGATRLSLDATGTASLLRAARESSAYYEAELEPERGEVVGRSRPFAVKALRRDVSVRARPEIVLRDPLRKAAAARLTVPDLLGSFEAVTELPLRVAGFTVREATDRLRVGVLVETVDSGAALASVGAILIAPDGRVVGRWFAKDASERPLLGAIAAPPGTYTLRVAALDAAGRAGVAEDSVDVSLAQAGPLSIGGLMLGVSRPEGMRLQLEFATEPSAIASFDIYGGTPATRLGAALEIARTADGPALATLPVTFTRVDETRVTATATVPLGALAPGDYVIRALVRLEDGTIGQVTRTLRKAVK